MGYKSTKRNHSIFSSRQANQLEQLNATVFIRDLVVTTPKAGGTGEAQTHNNIYGEKANTRLRDHIRFLCNLANEEHRANDCVLLADNTYRPKNNRENHITRLLTNEFSFYTEHPLPMAHFEALISDILTFDLDPNVHVLLSSFAVKDKSGKIVNMALYLEGGSPPTLHSFAKNTAHSKELDYGEEAFSQQKRGYQVSFHAEASIAATGESVPMAGIFECSTVGGATYTQAIDICSDHASAHAKVLAYRRLRAPVPAELLPEQIEHCISSNSVTQQKKHSITDCVIQADPIVSVHEATGLPLNRGTLTDDSKARLKSSDQYSLLEINTCDTGYEIKNPIFGSDCHIEILEARQAGHYAPELQSELLAHNERFLAQKTEKLYHSNPKYPS